MKQNACLQNKRVRASERSSKSHFASHIFSNRLALRAIKLFLRMFFGGKTHNNDNNDNNDINDNSNTNNHNNNNA